MEIYIYEKYKEKGKTQLFGAYSFVDILPFEAYI